MSTPIFNFQFTLFFIIGVLCIYLSAGNSHIRCTEKEKQALLKFKLGLNDTENLLSSWESEVDCCSWKGISCSNQTGHVTKLVLDLSKFSDSKAISGMIDPSLCELQDLTYLDLSYFDFKGHGIPHCIGLLSQLRSLTLYDDELSGIIPHELSNLSNLQNLDLSSNDLDGIIPDKFANMVLLEYLDFSGNQFVGGIPKSFSHLCHLEELYLHSNNLNDTIAHSMQQLCCSPNSLRRLCLIDNPFSSGPFPEITRFSSLETLTFRNTSLEGKLPHSFGYFPNLTELDLSYNNLSGSLPEFMGFPSMKSLDLSHNKLNGALPYSLGQLSNLTSVFLSSNMINDIISEEHLSNLSKLSSLDVSHNVLSFNLSSNWVPPFQLRELYASFCIIGPRFPMWIKNQRTLDFLDLSNSGISDSIPEWVWHLSSNFLGLNFSQNKIHGALPKSLPEVLSLDFPTYYDLSFNQLSGPLPHFPSNIVILSLSNNKLSGSFTFNCTIPGLGLHYLDISNNLLSGELPDCWDKFELLLILNLANNNFSGVIPKSIGFLDNIATIHLNNNNFSGGIPSLVNCTSLYSIDLGENNLNGNLPAWIGHNLTKLIVLRLQGNMFHGSIPMSLCNLNHLQILDLSQNKMSGKIPDCLNNIDALSNITYAKDIMVLEASDFGYYRFESYVIFIDEAVLAWKGQNYKYGKNLGLMTMIDFSCNHLDGEIPSTMTSLLGLVSLNLSRNNLTGFIPNNFGKMKSLESLDLSRNGLSGRIPSSFSNLTWLAVLNLSFNNLSGQIPSSTQLQSFEASAYMGNVGLCGPPLRKQCQRNGTENTSASPDGDDDKIITFGFYVSLGLGFIIGFWGVCGSLILKSSWRQAYFLFLMNMYDWLFVHVVVFVARMKRRFRNLKEHCTSGL